MNQATTIPAEVKLCLTPDVLNADVLVCQCGDRVEIGRARRAQRILAFARKHVRKCGVSAVSRV